MPARSIDELFHGALEQRPEEREDFLRRACAGDEELYARITYLLAFHDKIGSFMRAPILEPRGAKQDPDSSSPPTVTEKLAMDRFSPGQLLGDRYRMEALLGRGGMGEVWRAYDLKLRVDVALKCLHRDLFSTERGLELLRHEVRSARNVMSPHVCRIFDLVAEDGQELVSMEYIDGRTLQALLRDKAPLDLREAGEIAAQLLAGLEAIHEADLVHRDVKPSNVMITRAGRVVLMDFGLAKGLADIKEGSIAGTPAYMAPEQARGAALDARADIFAAGVILAEMIGPKDQPSREALWAGVREDPAKVPEGPWEGVLRKAVAWDPNGRYSTAKEMSRALEEVTLRAEGIEERSPYPGLNPFTEKDAEYFFGREAEVETVWKKLQRSHLLAVIGISGVGKSSFLRAGLVPAAAADWRCVVCTPGASPFKALGQTMVPEMSGDDEAMGQLFELEQPGVALNIFSKWRRRHGETLLILDQFEELFTLNRPKVQNRFAKLIEQLSMEADVHVLISMRDDFLFQCEEYPALHPVLTDLTLMGRLSGSALRRALVQPALACGYRYEDDSLVDEMIEEIREERGALPLLAFAAASMWEHRDRATGTLTRKAYERIGGVGGALARHAEATMERIGVPRHPIVREVFRNLSTAHGTRAVRVTEELLTLFENQEEAREVLRQLIEARLITSFDAPGSEDGDDVGQRVEVIHESLLTAWPRVVRWRTQDAEGAQLHDQLRQAAQLWLERSQSDDLLWTGTAFKEFELWRERYEGGLTESERAFAEAMERRARQQRVRRRMGFVSVILVLLAVLGVVTVSRQQAIRESRRAEASRLLTLARTKLESDATSALAHTIASLELADTPEARRFALKTLWQGPVSIRLPGPALGSSEPGAYSCAFSPDGRWLAEGRWEATDQDSVGVLIWPSDGRPATRVRPSPGKFFHLGGFDPSSTRLLYTRVATGTSDLVSVPDGQLLKRFWPSTTGPGDRYFRSGILTASRAIILSQHIKPGAPLVVHSWPQSGDSTRILGSTPIRYFCFSFDHDRVVSSSGTDIIVQRMNDSELSQPVLIGSQDAATTTLYIEQSNDQLAVINEANRVTFWSMRHSNGSPIRTLTADGEGPFNLLRLSRDGRWLAWSVGGGGGSGVWLADLAGPPDASPRLMGETGSGLLDMDFHPTGQWLATASSGGAAIWPTQGLHVYTIPSNYGQVVFDPSGGALISFSEGGGIERWPMRWSAERPSRDTIVTGFYGWFDLDVDPTGSFVVVGTNAPDPIRLVSLEDGSVRNLPGFGHSVEAVAIDGSGRRVAGGGGKDDVQRFLRIWDLEADTAENLEELPEDGRFSDLIFTSEGHLISCGLPDLRLWNLDDETHEVLLEESFWNMDLSPDERHLVAVRWTHPNDFSGPLTILDLQSGLARELPSHGDAVVDVCFHPNGPRIASVDKHGIVRIGPLDGSEPHLLLGHEGPVNSVAISPDGRWIATSGERSIRLWLVPEGTPPHTLPHDEFMKKLGSFTNVRAVKDETAPDGYWLTAEPFPGWDRLPIW